MFISGTKSIEKMCNFLLRINISSGARVEIIHMAQCFFRGLIKIIILDGLIKHFDFQGDQDISGTLNVFCVLHSLEFFERTS